jgi:hypothetical protein
MQDEIAYAVRGLVGPPPNLLIGQRFDTGVQACPVVIEQLAAGELEEEMRKVGLRVGH